MEMVQAKMILAATAVALCLCSCSQGPYEWHKHIIDGHRTGVVASNAENAEEAMGKVENGRYVSPNGNVYEQGATPKAAQLMLSLEPMMKTLKTKVGHTDHGMTRKRPECELSNWFIDEFRRAAAEITGEKIDLAITNFGGIRVDFPAGDVLYDDVVSMFPFRNYVVYLEVKGADLRRAFEQMAHHDPQVVSGVRLVLDMDKEQLVSAEIGGEPLNDDKYYGLATIDFMMDGGDHYYLARNARRFKITPVKVVDIALAYVQRLEAEGKAIEGALDGRIVEIRKEK